MEAVMRKKYDIPEISIYRFLKPERREQIKPQDRHNRPYTKKDTEYWAKFERKKTDYAKRTSNPDSQTAIGVVFCNRCLEFATTDRKSQNAVLVL